MRHGNFTDSTDAKFSWQVFKSLWPYLLEFKARVGFALLCLLLAKLASICLPFILKYTVDSLENRNSSEFILAVPVGFVILYGVTRLLNVLFNELRDSLFGRVTERTIRKVGLRTFEHLHQLDLDFHLNRRTGGLSRDIERGTTGINFLMRFMIFNIVPTLFEVLMVSFLLLINYGLVFALITLFSVIIYVSFSVIATEWRTKFIREANRADSASNTRTVDSLLNYETVKYFGNEDYEAACYDKELALWEQAKRKNRLTLFALNAGQAMIIASAMTLMMTLATMGVADGSMTLGDFVLINAFMMQLFIPLNFLGFVYREIKGALTNIEQMFNLLKQKSSVMDAVDAEELCDTQGRIVFDNVSFHYQPDRPILKGVSFCVEPGKKVAVVGESGSGKSTLVKLLFRFYDTSEGSISIDGREIQSLTLNSLRKSIGIVPQDTVLFNDAIFENVRYGRTTASDAEVYEAIHLAHLDSFIAALPKGVDTTVGERGLKLSGGEKQRVAIARTILKRPPILVFDEATSSLDSQSEQAILASLRELEKGYTSLVIAHRLSTIVDADTIVVLGQGQVIEQGTHQELLAKQGAYASLWSAQQEKNQARK